MDNVTIDSDIIIFYVTASSYPEGIMEAHTRLHGLVPFSADRNYFGISRPENGRIVYRAAAEEQFSGEAGQYNCDTLVLKKGTYTALTIRNFRENPQRIATAFEELLAIPNLDPEGYCVEWYLNDEESVQCMVRMKDCRSRK